MAREVQAACWRVGWPGVGGRTTEMGAERGWGREVGREGERMREEGGRRDEEELR